jgi:structural maintenance of chromosome 4
VFQAFEAAKEVEAEKREALEEAEKEFEILKKSQSEVKCVEVELVGKVDALSKQLSDCEKRKKKWEAEISKLRNASEEDDMSDHSDSEDDEEEDKESEKGDGDVEMEDADSSDVRKKSPSSLPTFSFKSLEKYDKDDVAAEISVLETERNTIAKNANMGAIAEYRKKEADYLAR